MREERGMKAIRKNHKCYIVTDGGEELEIIGFGSLEVYVAIDGWETKAISLSTEQEKKLLDFVR